MARISYLQRRNAVYYALMDIPSDLVEHYKTKQRWKSLKTKDLEEAKKRLNPVIDLWRAEFEDVRSRRELTANDKAEAVWQHYSDTLERDEQKRTSAPTETDIDTLTKDTIESIQRDKVDIRNPLSMLSAGIELSAMKADAKLNTLYRRAKLYDLKKHLAKGETVLVDHAVTDFINRNKLIVTNGSPERMDLARKLMRAEIEALERTLERDNGDYSGSPKDPIVKPVTGTARQQAIKGETILELFEIYAAENPRNISSDTLNQARRDIGTFVDYVGSNCPVSRMDKKAVREWKALLMRYPVKASETKAFSGMKIAQIVKYNEKVGKPVLTPRTVNRYLSNLGAFCNWLVNHGYIDQNPTDGMSLSKEKKISTLPFTTEQLNTLFKSPLFVGCKSATEWRNISKTGSIKIRDHRFWVPLIMLYSGARNAEVAQLNIDDVRQEHGHWIMHITEEGDGEKSVKTRGSMRVVPIHSELIKFGFLNYHAELKQSGQSRLFPLAGRNSRGQMMADFSREFSRYLEHIGMKIGRGLSLYSFRHGVADALRRAGYLDEQFGFILGHTSGTMTGRYGMMPEGMLQQRVDLIESISYQGLDLSHLTDNKK